MRDLLPFLLLAVLLSVTPGPDAVLVLRSSVRGGRRLGSATALGAATGSLLWGMLATVGLAVVIAQSAALYQAIRLAGAAVCSTSPSSHSSFPPGRRCCSTRCC